MKKQSEMTKRGDKTRKGREKRRGQERKEKRGPEEGVGERETIERGKGGWGERERERDEIIALLVVCCHSGQIACLSLSLSRRHRLHSRM